MDSRNDIDQSGPTTKQQIAELQAAGWTAKSRIVWVSPCGRLFRGTHAAWKDMQRSGRGTGRNMSTERDPRTHPRPGDVLLRGTQRATVMQVARWVECSLTEDSARGIRALPMNRRLSGEQWREWAQNAEVVTKGTDATE